MKNNQFLTNILVLILSVYPVQANTLIRADNEPSPTPVNLLQDEEEPVEENPAVDLSLLPTKETLVHTDFVLDFPSSYNSVERDGLVITTCEGNEYSLVSLQCPIGLEETGIHMMASEVDALLDMKTAREVEIDCLNLKAYDAKKMFTESDSDFGVMYALNTGEHTYLFLQISRSETDWWTSHINWKFDGKTQKTPSELLSHFNEFLRKQMRSAIQNEINISEEEGNIRITLIEEEKALQKDKAAMTIFNLIKNFSVFNDFAANKYVFVIEQLDSDGHKKAEYSFPHSQYSTWEDINHIMESFDQEMGEGVKEQSHRTIGG